MSTVITGEIFRLLKEKHSGDEWAFFCELRTRPGHMGRAGYIDAYAAGMWNENKSFVAYEVKSDKSDFKKDIEQFAVKQEVAIRNSNQFFYVVPQGMIEPNEVPDSAGLIYLNKGGLRTKKIAPFRDLKNGALDVEFTRSLLRAAVEQAGRENRKLTTDIDGLKAKADFASKYGGREVNATDLMTIAKDMAHLWNEDKVDQKAREIAAERRLRSYLALKRIAEAADLGPTHFREIYDEKVLEDLCQVVRLAARLQSSAAYAVNQCNDMCDRSRRLTGDVEYMHKELANFRPPKKV